MITFDLTISACGKVDAETEDRRDEITGLILYDWSIEE